MAKIRVLEVDVSDGVDFVVPMDCTAVRAVSDVSVTVESYADSARSASTGNSTAGTNTVLDSKAFGRFIRITGTGVGSLNVVIQLD